MTDQIRKNNMDQGDDLFLFNEALKLGFKIQFGTEYSNFLTYCIFLFSFSLTALIFSSTTEAKSCWLFIC